MNSMRQMQNHMMSNMLTDPFRMLGMGMGGMGFGSLVPRMNNMNNSMMMHGGPQFPGMNLNRLLSGPENGVSYSSSSVFSVMSSGSDGRPQVYHETSSVRKGPGGLKETRHTVQDSTTGKKKMAIGHHLGEKGHVVEKEQNLHTGEREEREDFINLDESDTEEFERDFQQKARQSSGRSRAQIEEISSEPLRAIQCSRPRATIEEIPSEPLRAIQSSRQRATIEEIPSEPLRAIQSSRPRATIEEISSEPLPLIQS